MLPPALLLLPPPPPLPAPPPPPPPPAPPAPSPLAAYLDTEMARCQRARVRCDPRSIRTARSARPFTCPTHCHSRRAVQGRNRSTVDGRWYRVVVITLLLSPLVWQRGMMETADLCGKIGRKTGRRPGVGVVVVVVVGGGGGEIKQKSMGEEGGGGTKGEVERGSGPVILSQSTRSAGLVGVDDVQANRKIT